MRPFFQNSYSLGLIFGCFLGGSIADKFGRRWAILIGSILHVFGSIAVALTPWFPLLLLSRFIVGMSNLIILLPGITLALETVPSQWRGPVGILVGLPYSMAVIWFAGSGYFIRDWRLLYTVSSLPAVLLIPTAWFVDESPRWLLQMDRGDDAIRILQKAAKRNKSGLQEEHEIRKRIKPTGQSNESQTSETTLKLRILKELREAKFFLGSSMMKRITIIAPLAKCTSEILYYGIIFNANNFSSSDPFTYVAMNGVADAAAIAGGMLAVKYLPLRVTASCGNIFSGVLVLLVLVVPESLRWLQWLLVMTGFFLVAVAAQTFYVYFPELFPTTLRARGVALTSVYGNIGTFIAPFVSDVFVEFGDWVPSTILGLSGIVAGILVLFLPETKGTAMCETVDDIEKRGFYFVGKKPKLR